MESSWSSSRPPKCTSHRGFSLGTGPAVLSVLHRNLRPACKIAGLVGVRYLNSGWQRITLMHNPEETGGKRRMEEKRMQRSQGERKGVRDEDIRRRASQELFGDGAFCVRCRHPKGVHGCLRGADDVHRVFCLSCPLTTTRVMGDEGSDFPIPFLLEMDFGPPAPCFEERRTNRRMENFLPRSPGSRGGVELTLRATGGGNDSEIRFIGSPWRVDEIEQLQPGDDVRYNLAYKHQLYWDQGTRCAGCQRPIWFDNIELDRMIPGACGGTYTVGNVQLLCPRCNKLKGDRSMEYLRLHLQSEGLPDSPSVEA